MKVPSQFVAVNHDLLAHDDIPHSQTTFYLVEVRIAGGGGSYGGVIFTAWRPDGDLCIEDVFAEVLYQIGTSSSGLLEDSPHFED